MKQTSTESNAGAANACFASTLRRTAHPGCCGVPAFDCGGVRGILHSDLPSAPLLGRKVAPLLCALILEPIIAAKAKARMLSTQNNNSGRAAVMNSSQQVEHGRTRAEVAKLAKVSEQTTSPNSYPISRTSNRLPLAPVPEAWGESFTVSRFCRFGSGDAAGVRVRQACGFRTASGVSIFSAACPPSIGRPPITRESARYRIGSTHLTTKREQERKDYTRYERINYTSEIGRSDH